MCEENEENQENKDSEDEGVNLPEKRVRRKSVWMTDYESGAGLSDEENEGVEQLTQEMQQLAMFVSNDPATFEEAAKSQVDATTYKQMVGSLMYLTATRPDLMYVVSLVARFMEAPTTMHQQDVKRVLRYIRGTTELGLFYKRESEENLVAFCDSDYPGDLEDRKSTSGYVFKMSNGLVAGSSKKQSVVSLSTTEAEFISAAVCAAQSIWMMRVFERLEIKQSRVLSNGCSAGRVLSDGCSAGGLLPDGYISGRLLSDGTMGTVSSHKGKAGLILSLGAELCLSWE
ncbi:hypothetical protein KIW84_022315 [Lathyrus oleraceus]|uniref:Uncharacterized protein n=1 Tax=Pisum sativum TaxID=3888 RepID=A0A9D4YA42_PEA|nr:hypothetical protein KIW84_022315 [Pisum sativum]